MQFYSNGEIKEYGNDRLEYLDEGFECFVYRFGDDKVLKEFKTRPTKRTWLTKESIERMKEIKTKRILLPTFALTDESEKLKAYEMDYVEDYGINSYFDLDKENLIKENDTLREDIELLSDNKLLVEDLVNENSSFHDGIYFIDPGSYIFDDNMHVNQVHGINMDLINEYLIYQVISGYHLVKYNKRKSLKISQAFGKKIQHEYNESGKRDMIEFLSEIEENSLSDFVQRRVNKQ